MIEEAASAGARRFKACEVLEINVRTLQRWNKTLAEEKRLVDQRRVPASERTPTNKLSDKEREAILSVCSKREFQSLPPSQIVPRLADNGEYKTSESSFYRVLRQADQVHPLKYTPAYPSKPFESTEAARKWVHGFVQ